MKNDEYNTVHERINILVNHFAKGNKTAFGRESGILPGVLASITGGRMSKPSFELLQKIISRYPEVNGDWLITGRLPMFHHPALTSEQMLGIVKEAGEKVMNERIMQSFTSEQMKEIVKAVSDVYTNDETLRLRTGEQMAEHMASARVANEAFAQMYTVADKSPSRNQRRLLSTRLDISDEEAQRLVLSSKIPALKISEEEGYRISEQAVREFIDSASKAST